LNQILLDDGRGERERDGEEEEEEEERLKEFDK
jgi:hypothetical protein